MLYVRWRPIFPDSLWKLNKCSRDRTHSSLWNTIAVKSLFKSYIPILRSTAMDSFTLVYGCFHTSMATEKV